MGTSNSHSQYPTTGHWTDIVAKAKFGAKVRSSNLLEEPCVKILCLASGYASYGASILTTAAEHLERTLKDVEPTELAIEVVAFLWHEGPPKLTLERSLEQHILRYPKRVRARYRSKVSKLHIEYPSNLRESESFGKPGGIYAVAHVLPRALDELSEAVVEGLRSRQAIWRKMDASQLAHAIEESKASLPTDSDSILNYMRQLDEARRASVKTPASLDELEIEWTQYHPAARRVLDAPLFWSETDDDAPHGNDTGSDLLAAFKRWNKRNPAGSYEGYVDRLLSRWGLTPEKARGQLDETQLDSVRQEADIALAFAAIKVRGSCEGREARAAISAIDKRIEQLSNAPARVRKLLQLRATLQTSALEMIAAQTS